MSMRWLLRVCLVCVVCAAGSAHADWPSLAGVPPLSIVFHTPNDRQAGDHVLPGAQIHGPEGLSDLPTVNRRAHRQYGKTTVRFPRPVYRGQRLDWCSSPGIECGPSTAQHFCEAAGFARVIELVQERDVGLYAETRQIASGLSCTGRGCHGFMRITCTKS